jgi:hypothetical protein
LYAISAEFGVIIKGKGDSLKCAVHIGSAFEAPESSKKGQKENPTDMAKPCSPGCVPY